MSIDDKDEILPDAEDGPDTHDYFFPEWADLAKFAGIQAEDIGKETVNVRSEFIRLLIQQLLDTLPFSEKAYIKANPDIAQAIKTGQVASGSQHYAMTGYFEGRYAGNFAVNPTWYLGNNSDIREAALRGDISDATRHFQSTGYHEGRTGTEEQLRMRKSWSVLLD
ncbi:MAG: hypothetical protein AAF225_11100 [Pseudomonadota bacterium]